VSGWVFVVAIVLPALAVCAGCSRNGADLILNQSTEKRRMTSRPIRARHGSTQEPSESARCAGTHGLVRQVVLRRQAVLPWQSVPYRKRGAISFRRFIEYDITTLHGLPHDAAADRHAMAWSRISSYPAVQVTRRHVDVATSSRREDVVELTSKVVCIWHMLPQRLT